MKKISRKIWLEDSLIDGKVDPAILHFPAEENEMPLYLQPDCLTAEACDELVRTAISDGESVKGSTGDVTGSNKVDLQGRNVDVHKLPAEFARQYSALIFDYLEPIETFFGMEIERSESPKFMSYPPGGHYHMHSDNCEPRLDAQGNVEGFSYTRSDRQLSTVLFLSDGVEAQPGENECVGGELGFGLLRYDNGNMYTVTPQKGLLVAFPSHPAYAHQVFPVQAGYRATIVDWYKAQTTAAG